MNYVYKNFFGKDTIISQGSPLHNADLSIICGEMKCSWVTLLDKSFTDQSIEINKNSNSFSIDGFVFDIINNENIDKICCDNNGISIKVNENESEWFSAKRTFPGIVFNIKQLFHEYNQELDNISSFDYRIVAQVYGQDETETFEQTNCGIEIREKLPENNQISYFLRSSDGKGSLFHGTQVTNKNISFDFAKSYSNDDINIVVFEMTDGKKVSIFTHNTTQFNEKFNINELCNAKYVSDVFWSECSENNAFEKISDLNFCFGPTTSNKNRKNISFLLRLCIQVRPK